MRFTVARAKRIITNTEIEKICTEYKAGKSIRQLRTETKLQQKRIANILNDNGIKILTAYEAQQKMAGLEVRNYFDELNELQCYVLGLIFGDGCVHYNTQKYKYSLTIVSNDLDILTSAKTLFGDNFKITKRKTSNAYNFVINSKHLCEELITKFHLQSPKSNSLIWPKLPENMYPCFISGLLSTDGCIRIDSRRIGKPCGLEFSYSSNSLDFIENLQKYIIGILQISQTKIKINKTNRKNKNYSIRYTGEQAVKILNFIYDACTELTRCERKFNLYQNFLNTLDLGFKLDNVA
jgi:hypothetical protein